MSNSRPKTVQVFLPNGNPQVIRVTLITSRTVQAVKIPRKKLEAERKTVASGFMFCLAPQREMRASRPLTSARPKAASSSSKPTSRREISGLRRSRSRSRPAAARCVRTFAIRGFDGYSSVGEFHRVLKAVLLLRPIDLHLNYCAYA